MEQRVVKTFSNFKWSEINQLSKFISQENWIFYTTLNDEYKGALAYLTETMFDLQFLFELRYIKTHQKYIKNLEKATSNKNIGGVIEYVENYGSIEAIVEIIPFETFKTTEKRRLFKALDAILGQTNSIELYKQRVNSCKFNIFDFGFFSYLLNTFDSPSSKKMRLKKYKEIDADFYNNIKRGLESSVKYHPNIGNAIEKVKSWGFDPNDLEKRFSSEINLLNYIIEKNYNKALSNSDFEKKNEEIKLIIKSIRELRMKLCQNSDL